MALLHECYLVLFFFFPCSRSCTNINEYEHLKKRPSGNAKQWWIQGEGEERKGGGGNGPPPIRTVGTFISYLKV